MSEPATREAAIADLLGGRVQSGRTSFPDSITLPEVLHAGTLAAVAKTAQDARERCFKFHYDHDQWLGSTAVRGGEHSIRGYRFAMLKLRRPYVSHPHILVHTHPPLSREKMREEDEERLAFLAATASFPSVGDFGRHLFARSMASGAIGNMIGSPTGITLMLKTDVAWEPPELRLTEEKRKAVLAYHESRQPEQYSAGQSVLAASTFKLAAALAPQYVAYHTPDTDSPCLDRVVAA